MRTLIISIYGSGWEFNAASLSNLDYRTLDEDNTNELHDIYDYNEDYANPIFEWAQNHHYNNVIICEDGHICFKALLQN